MDASEYDPTQDWKPQWERWLAENYGGEPGYNEAGRFVGARALDIQEPSDLTLLPYEREATPTDPFDYEAAGLDEDEVKAARRQYLEAMMPTFNIGEFESLLSKLEGSKMKQAEQKGRIDRRGTLSQGLASMMRNF